MTTPAAPEPDAEVPEGRINAATDAFMTGILRAICPAGAGTQRMRLHVGNPGVGGLNVAAAVPAANISWGAVTGGGAAIAECTAAPVVFNNVPFNAQPYSHYGVYDNAGLFLYGKPLSSPVSVPNGATGTITVTPKHTYDLQ